MKPLPDWDALSFSLTETDAIWVCRGDTRRDPVWDAGTLRPFEDLAISVASPALSYGLGIFEGMKAQRAPDGTILLFRPDRNAERFRKSAERLTLAPFPEARFIEAVKETVRANARFVPPHGRGTFYVRPVEWASEARLGLGMVNGFTVAMYGSPVGGYFKVGGAPGLRLLVKEQGRVAPGGTGWAKAAGNYAGGILVSAEAKKQGFDDVLYLDARHVRFVTETSGSNVFCALRNGTLVTPPLDDQILPGVTRLSAIEVARSLGMRVEERPIGIDEVVADGAGLFATGTAYTLARIHSVTLRGKETSFPDDTARAAIFEIIRGIQNGTREDTFGWTVPVDQTRRA
ncbi:MAG: Branched-chain-amino-acid transaminase 1 [Planctomycetes bacterium]|nr:Branched-chain-amino-acid transaminase 1 [Planctomycetota bacterium]